MKTILFFVGLLATLVLTRCHSSQTETTLSGHQTRLVSVADSVTLEVLDWGGEGQALVFLAGLGNTAHVFDEFAPNLPITTTSMPSHAGDSASHPNP
ncbi:alpha/beta fold hydrolase [Spirosoma sp. KNUC1025]|uniref:alpha/beta fold hydrolase n=1 Tax=Spirosoma sp. KNUC1025 TaxID=2894082 RepID=UPI001E545604|nr:hypothetical protein [Spirosoma sp. KNUC1025]UFH57788.1 hypothetical protein LN737_32720 [Spirosoma sp. KNUC1025]